MAHSLSALLESGVSMGTALVFAARATSDAELEARLALARGAVTAGEPLSRALELHAATTPTCVVVAFDYPTTTQVVGVLDPRK